MPSLVSYRLDGVWAIYLIRSTAMTFCLPKSRSAKYPAISSFQLLLSLVF